ncbi:MAG TPA: hypothetical protein DCL48_06605 [Alphaproteobacteria bacterium]|nr:hypothetical protein [Alphaproteobacteria bacterium]
MMLAAGVNSAFASLTQRSAQYGFEISFPEGWTTVPGATPRIVFAARSGIAPDSATCAVSAEDKPLTARATQAELNTLLQRPFGQAFWREVHRASGNLAFESDSVKTHPSGIVTQEAVVTFMAANETGSVRVKLLSTILIVPGVQYQITCGAREGTFETYRPAILATIDSFRRTLP